MHEQVIVTCVLNLVCLHRAIYTSWEYTKQMVPVYTNPYLQNNFYKVECTNLVEYTIVL